MTMIPLSMKDLADIARHRVRNNYDCQIVIDGDRGKGKSNLAVALAMLMQEDYSIEKGTVARRDQNIDAIETFAKYSVIHNDEATNTLYKRDFMKSAQKQIIRLLDMCRKRNLINLWCTPSIWGLDSDFLARHVQLWIHVYERGMAHVYTPLKGEGFAYISDPWCRKINLNQYLGYKFSYSPNYMGTLRFPKLPAHLEEEYLKVLGEKSVDDPVEAAKDKKEKKRHLEAAKSAGLFTFESEG